jgi:hypothetical protein
MVCKICELDFGSKKWGYANICGDCDESTAVNKSMAILIADGKTDYHFQIIRNPSDQDAAAISAIGRAWDPRSQLRAINKVSK